MSPFVTCSQGPAREQRVARVVTLSAMAVAFHAMGGPIVTLAATLAVTFAPTVLHAPALLVEQAVMIVVMEHAAKFAILDATQAVILVVIYATLDAQQAVMMDVTQAVILLVTQAAVILAAIFLAMDPAILVATQAVT